MKSEFQDRLAVVTGASSGIGLALCRQLADRGDRVVAACRSPSNELNALDVRVEEGVGPGQDPDMLGDRAGHHPEEDQRAGTGRRRFYFDHHAYFSFCFGSCCFGDGFCPEFFPFYSFDDGLVC